MKFSQVLAALAIVAMCGCKAGTPSNTENKVMSEVKHEVTIGGKDVKNPDCLYTRRCQGRRRTLPASLPDMPWLGRAEHRRSVRDKDGPAGG